MIAYSRYNLDIFNYVLLFDNIRSKVLCGWLDQSHQVLPLRLAKARELGELRQKIMYSASCTRFHSNWPEPPDNWKATYEPSNGLMGFYRQAAPETP